MAAPHKAGGNFAETRPQYELARSSGLRSFIHKRNNSDGVTLPSSLATPHPPGSPRLEKLDAPSSKKPPTMASQKLSIDTQQTGQLDSLYPPPSRAIRDGGNDGLQHPRSPSKSGLATLTAKFSKDKSIKETSPTKPQKIISSTNIVGLLTRPKSSKNLSKLASDQGPQQGKNKENRTPSDSSSDSPPTPIYAQFCRGALGQAVSVPNSPYEMSVDPFTQASLLNINNSFRPSASDNAPGQKLRPRSFQPQYTSNADLSQMDQRKETRGRSKIDEPAFGQRSSTCGKGRSRSRTGVLSTIANRGGQKSKTPSPAPEANEPVINHNDIDKHLEAMLDRRNIPENQRYKMRNLNSTIKMEFIRQDWAENEAKKLDRPRTNDSDDSAVDLRNASVRDNDKKHSRGRSFTFSRNSWKIGGSPSKSKKKEPSFRGHTRNKSQDSVISERPSSAGSYSSNGIIAKVTGQQPSDFVNYLRKAQKPEAVEVGKLHKLRLLLRNERVAWTEEFIRQGGMKEIVGLLYRIMEVEWREEHEDALLHENLLCLKALCTTALALQYLHSIQEALFPALIHMIFDPERKGPSEFTTRNIITSMFLTYIQSGTPQERVMRAQTVLSYLRDPEAKEEERPVNFVLEMRRERPYRVWNKEVVSVTKEVFWIFLHNLNVVALPVADKVSSNNNSTYGATAVADANTYAYMTRHFPQERPPVPAAPYVGGVEWDATNYLASHLDLMNAIIACTPTMDERNNLRKQFRVSGWERCLGGSLRLCKEKFYPGVHDALRTWVAAAAEDGWEVRDVRYGPPPESRNSPPKKSTAGGGAGGAKKKAEEPPPRLEMPKLDFVLDGPLSAAP